MKSLELINERIENLESRLESANYLANGNPSEFGKTVIGDLAKHLDSCKQIKADLEVLEIIRNKRVNVAELVGELIYFDNDEDVLEDYNSILCKGRQLTLTELLKLKQWLEVNENDR